MGWLKNYLYKKIGNAVSDLKQNATDKIIEMLKGDTLEKILEDCTDILMWIDSNDLIVRILKNNHEKVKGVIKYLLLNSDSGKKFRVWDIAKHDDIYFRYKIIEYLFIFLNPLISTKLSYFEKTDAHPSTFLTGDENSNFNNGLKKIVEGGFDPTRNKLFGKIIFAKPQDQVVALNKAISDRNFSHFEVILDFIDADHIHYCDEIRTSGYTSLLLALVNRQEKMAIKLIKAGADPSLMRNRKDEWYGYNALHIAIYRKYAEVVVAIFTCGHKNLKDTVDKKIYRKGRTFGENYHSTPVKMAQKYDAKNEKQIKETVERNTDLFKKQPHHASAVDQKDNKDKNEIKAETVNNENNSSCVIT